MRRELDNTPPDDGYEYAGKWCHYHGGKLGDIYCQNPLDCDVSTVWRLTDDAFHEQLRSVGDGDTP